MKYMVTFPLTSAHYQERVSSFLETGAPAPDGVEILGRWFTLGHSRGWIIVETDDPTKVFQFVSEWAHIMDFEVHAVIEDEQAGGVLQALQG